MSYIYELQYYLGSASIGIVFELLLVTTCISTIIFLITKNQYISYLSAAPIFYFISKMFYHDTHFIFILFAMTVQALVILLIQKQRNLNEEALKSKTQKF
jgi:type IV secretory pathway VirB3-like protein